MIDHTGDCTAMPCICGARARVWAKRNAELEASQPSLLTERLGTAGDGDG